MAMVDVGDVGKFGIISDLRPHELPLNAWSAGRNVRFRHNYVEHFLGEAALLSPGAIAPYFLMPADKAGETYWILAGLSKVHATRGAVPWNDITRASGGDYSATPDLNWTGCVFNGIPVINNGIDAPQAWNPIDFAQRLVVLANWPANYTCKAMGAYKNFLIAMDITNALGARFPRMVKWSTGAGAGQLPITWDETDPAQDAGEYDISESDDALVDGAPLRDIFVLYKEESVWGMQYTGGLAVHRIFKLFSSFGIASRRCAVEFIFGKHLVYTGDDVIVHDGQSAHSIAEGRIRQELQATLNYSKVQRSFVVANVERTELWICYPQVGDELPTRAIVWNWETGAIGFRGLPKYAHLAKGPLAELVGSQAWDDQIGSWDTDSGAWDNELHGFTRQRLIGARPEDLSLYRLDETLAFTTGCISCFVERLGLGVPFETGKPPDMNSMKFIRGLWPRLEGTAGAEIIVEVGEQQEIGGPIQWHLPYRFRLGVDTKVDFRASCRLLALRFSSEGEVDWRLHGYELDVVKGGAY